MKPCSYKMSFETLNPPPRHPPPLKIHVILGCTLSCWNMPCVGEINDLLKLYVMFYQIRLSCSFLFFSALFSKVRSRDHQRSGYPTWRLVNYNVISFRRTTQWQIIWMTILIFGFAAPFLPPDRQFDNSVPDQDHRDLRPQCCQKAVLRSLCVFLGGPFPLSGGQWEGAVRHKDNTVYIRRSNSGLCDWMVKNSGKKTVRRACCNTWLLHDKPCK